MDKAADGGFILFFFIKGTIKKNSIFLTLTF